MISSRRRGRTSPRSGATIVATGLALLVMALSSVGEADEDGATVGEPTVDALDRATRQLLVSADRGHLKAVRKALEDGARIDEKRVEFAGPDGQPALVAAALRGYAPVVRVLLRAGADSMAVEKDGFTVWHAAAFQGRANVLKVLDELAVPGYGPSPVDGMTPLHRAAWGRKPLHVRAVRYLIGPGGRDCDVRGPKGERPVDRTGHPQIREMLEACLAASRLDPKGESP